MTDEHTEWRNIYEELVTDISEIRHRSGLIDTELQVLEQGVTDAAEVCASGNTDDESRIDQAIELKESLSEQLNAVRAAVEELLTSITDAQQVTD